MQRGGSAAAQAEKPHESCRRAEAVSKSIPGIPVFNITIYFYHYDVSAGAVEEDGEIMKILQLTQKACQMIPERVKWAEQRLYNIRRKKRLKNRDFTIIASNCNGSFMYHDMGLRYLTPTVNLAIGMDDFVKMAENLKQYMEQEIVEVKGENGCPVGLLGDIRINFVHYDTFEEGRKKWEERKKRIHWENLFIIGTEKDGCSYEVEKKSGGEKHD